MRIANNIMAMNTHRSYTTNNDRVSTSAEKLSSGYRINKAGDDAAGLAISEKMRSQIRGLNMATRNAQDAISLIQTAEGALQEVHSILQRMNELAVQSATGTNEEFDRTQISKEFEQLKREINDISDQTTFNNMKLLDGSLSNEGVKRSAETTGVFVTDMETATPATMTTSPEGAKTATAGTAAKFTVDLSGNVKLTAGATMDLQISDGTNTQTITITNSGATDVTTVNDLAALITPGTLNLGGVNYDFTVANGKLTFEADAVGAQTDTAFTATFTAMSNGGTPDVPPTATEAAITDNGGTGAAEFDIDLTVTGTPGTKITAGSTVTIEFTANGTTFTATATATADIDTNTPAGLEALVDLFAGKSTNAGAITSGVGTENVSFTLTKGDQDTLVATAALTGQSDLAGNVTVTGITSNGNTGGDTYATTSATLNSAGVDADPVGTPGKNTIAFEGGIDGIKVGDVFKLDGKTYEVVADATKLTDPNATAIVFAKTDTSTMTDFVSAFQTAIDANYPDPAVAGYTLTDTADGFVLEQLVAGTGDTALYMTPATEKASTLEIDPAKLQSGDQIQITLTDKDGNEKIVNYLHNEGNTMQDIYERFQTELAGSPEVSLKGNNLVFAEGSAKLDFTAQPVESFGQMRIQVGALENEQVNVEIKAMNTAGLELDDADISNQDAAGEAITKVRDAVNMVSDQRALMGATQNRMQHKINNLKISAENLQAAESRIRDVDIAQEMTEFTKANILSQAATAMLAQANSAPQNVLSLLQ